MRQLAATGAARGTAWVNPVVLASDAGHSLAMVLRSMLVHTISAPLKQRLPSGVSGGSFRGLGTALVAPVVFSLDSGHARSALRGRAVDRPGSPLPWYILPPAVDLLRAKEFSDCRVLEFGAGHSTIWWAARARGVVTLRGRSAWCDGLSPFLPSNVSLRRVGGSSAAMAAVLSNEARFDIAVVDGLDRLQAARLALELMADDGAILFDNSEGYWGPPPSYPIIDLFRKAGLLRIDFYGYAPGVVLPHCTSLFCHGNCRLLRGGENPNSLQAVIRHAAPCVWSMATVAGRKIFVFRRVRWPRCERARSGAP